MFYDDCVMVDLETLGTSPGAVILSVGAVKFGAAGLGHTFYKVVSIGSCMMQGMTVSSDTLEWWRKQSDEAKMGVFGVMNAEPLVNVLDAFEEFLPYDAKFWCHGATFDAPILAHAYELFKRPVPWKFYNVRDTRTLFDLADVTVDRTAGTYHNALDDAMNQALTAIAAIKKLGVWS